jgi:hypothetical protein
VKRLLVRAGRVVRPLHMSLNHRLKTREELPGYLRGTCGEGNERLAA